MTFTYSKKACFSTSLLILALLLGFAVFGISRFYWQSGFLKVSFEAEKACELQVFYDVGKGVRIETMRKHPYQAGHTKLTIFYPKGLQSLRIDPSFHDHPMDEIRLSLKAPGSFFPSSIHTENLQSVNGALVTQAGSASDALRYRFEPIEGTNDPQWVISDKRLFQQPDHFPSLLWLIPPGTAILLLASGCGLLSFRIWLQRVSTEYLKTRRIPGFPIPPSAWNIRSLFLLSLFLAGSILTLKLDQTVGYEVSLHMKTENPGKLRVFSDFGSGFGLNSSMMETTSDLMKEYRFQFNRSGVLKRLRIDPMETEGRARVDRIRIREGLGPWHPLPLESFQFLDASTPSPEDDEVWNFKSLGKDPRMESEIGSLILTQPVSVFYWLKEFLLLMLATTLAIAISMITWRSWIHRKLAGNFTAPTLDFPDSTRAGIVHPICMGLINLGWILLAFFAFYPGALCGDTAGNIRTALEGRISPLDPPFLQIGIKLLQNITISQWPLLLIQLVLYFSGWFLLGLFVWRTWKTLWCYLFCIVPLLPQLFGIHSLVIKDVLIAGLWLNILALCLHLGRIRQVAVRIPILFLIAILLTASVLSRDNTFLAAPVVIWMIVHASRRNPIPMVQSIATRVVLYLLFAVMTYNLMRVANNWMLGPRDNRDYKSSFFVSQVAANDLIGISLRRNHQGITERLDQKNRLHLEYLYQERPVFWINNQVSRILFPDTNGILPHWLESLTAHPKDYLAHRIHLFRHLFLPRRDGALMWMGDAVDIAPFANTLGVNPQDLSKFARPPEFPGREFSKTYKRWSSLYFANHASWVFVIALGVALFMRGSTCQSDNRAARLAVSDSTICINNELKRIRSIVQSSFWVAAAYSLPNLFFVQHAESRYVYPAVVLIFAVAAIRWVDFWGTPNNARSSAGPSS